MTCLCVRAVLGCAASPEDAVNVNHLYSCSLCTMTQRSHYYDCCSCLHSMRSVGMFALFFQTYKVNKIIVRCIIRVRVAASRSWILPPSLSITLSLSRSSTTNYFLFVYTNHTAERFRGILRWGQKMTEILYFEFTFNAMAVRIHTNWKYEWNERNEWTDGKWNANRPNTNTEQKKKQHKTKQNRTNTVTFDSISLDYSA